MNGAAGWSGGAYNLVGALLIGALLPLLIRYAIPGGLLAEAPFNAFFGNIFAVLIAFWARLSIEPYPGIRSSYVIFPTAALSHLLVLSLFVFTRLPYDRVGFLAGFLLHVLLLYGIYFLIQLRIGMIPFGHYQRLAEIDSVIWLTLPRPRSDMLAECYALVADFSAALPPEWEGFLADSALAGKIVYQVKPLAESLTGRSSSTTSLKTASDRSYPHEVIST